MNEDFVPIVFRRAQALTLDSCGLKNRPTSIDVPENGRVMFYFCFFFPLLLPTTSVFCR